MATNHKINVDDLFAALLVIGLLYLINSAISKKHHAAGISNLGITIQADSAYCGMVPANAAMWAPGTYNTAFGYQDTLQEVRYFRLNLNEIKEEEMERYYIYTNDDARIKEEIDKDGDWVRYEDAAARIAELEAEIVERRKDYSACIRDQDARIAELEAQLAAAQEREAIYTEYKCKLEAIVTWLAHHERGAFAHDLWDILYE